MNDHKPVLPFGLKEIKPLTVLDPHKLSTFDLAPSKKNAFEKAKEKAQQKAEEEAAATAAALEEFEAEYGKTEVVAADDPAPRRFKSGARYLKELKSSKQRTYEPEQKENPPVLVSGLPHGTTQSSLLELLSKYGEVKSVNLQRTKATCSFATPENAVAAKAGLDGRYMGEGCRLSLELGKDINYNDDTLPFGAQPKVVNLARMAPPSARKVREGQALEVHVQRPTNLEATRRIHRVIQHVLEHGPPFEALLRRRETHNPDYEFLFSRDSDDSRYYSWMLYLAYQSEDVDTPRAEQYLYNTNIAWYPPQEDTGLPHDTRVQLWHYLRTITPQRRSIARITGLAMTNTHATDEIAEIMCASVCSPSVPWKTTIARVWAISDVLHNSALPIPDAWRFRKSFETRLVSVFTELRSLGDAIESRIRRENFKRLVNNIIQVWANWVCFEKDVIEDFRKAYNLDDIESSHEESAPEPVPEPTPQDTKEVAIPALDSDFMVPFGPHAESVNTVSSIASLPKLKLFGKARELAKLDQPAQPVQFVTAQSALTPDPLVPTQSSRSTQPAPTELKESRESQPSSNERSQYNSTKRKRQSAADFM